MKKIMEFLKQLVTVNESISSKRFLAVFILMPAIIITVFLKFEMSYVYALIGLFTALMGFTTAEKFTKNYGKSEA